MRQYLIAAVLTLTVVVAAGERAQAWNKPGHMVSGAVAYQVLNQESPQTLAKVVALLKKHPEYHRWEELAQGFSVPEEEHDLFLFMQAARWPDDARDDHEFYPPGKHLERWHYINLPLKPEGQPAWVKTAEPDDINLFRGYEENLAQVAGRGDADDRAVALCWIFHLIGDVHQPLHTASLFTTRFQKDEGQLIGDRGGTRFYIRPREDAGVISLHTFWDGLILGSDRFRDVRNRATELRNRAEFARNKLTELSEKDFERWAQDESFKLAQEVAYKNGSADLDGSPKRQLAPPLPAGYPKAAQLVAERRIVLAGYRLADVLKKSFP